MKQLKGLSDFRLLETRRLEVPGRAILLPSDAERGTNITACYKVYAQPPGDVVANSPGRQSRVSARVLLSPVR